MNARAHKLFGIGVTAKKIQWSRITDQRAELLPCRSVLRAVA
ncbi:MAG: hypothetical protein ACP5I8_08110 [Phycisphaerae bacterium]